MLQDMNSHPVWGISKGQKEKIAKDHIGKVIVFILTSLSRKKC